MARPSCPRLRVRSASPRRFAVNASPKRDIRMPCSSLLARAIRSPSLPAFSAASSSPCSGYIGPAARQQLLQRGTQVLVLLRELLEALGLFATREARFELLGESNEVLGKPVPKLLRRSRLRELLDGEFADRLEQPETSLGPAHEILV